MSFLPSQIVTVVIPPDDKLESIRTERLILRPIRLSDAAEIFVYRSQKTVADWLWPRIPDSDIQKTEQWLAGKVFTTPDASGAIGRRFSFVMIRKDDDEERIIGHLGINSLSPAPAAGYTLHPDFWKQGYASEALRGVIDAWWNLPRDPTAVKQLNQKEKLYAACNMANHGSLRVLRKNGFEVYLEISFESDVVACLHLDKPNSEATC